MLGLLLSLVTPSSILVFITALLLAYYVIWTPKWLKMPPGPFPLPVLGNYIDFLKIPDKADYHVFQSLARKYGKVFTIKLGSTYVVVISDYRLLIDSFVKKSDAFSSRPREVLYTIEYLNEELGTGIVTNDGPLWKQLRRTALTTMRDLGVGKTTLEEKIQEEARVLLDRIGQEKEQPFCIKPLFSLATSNVICEVIFGSRFDYEDDKFKELLRVLDLSFRINPILTPINFFPFLKRIPSFFNQIKGFSRTLLLTNKYVKELAESHEVTYDPENIRDFIDLFIKTRIEKNDDQTYDMRCMSRIIVDLFTAGSETTANALTWSILFMAKYPDVQKRCQKEIDDVIGRGKMMSMSEKEKLPYVEATVLEVLRKRPNGPTTIPHCTSRDVEFGGYTIPRNTVVFGNLIDINNDPAIFPNPEKFDPGHFLNTDGKIINQERMVSFSVGPRSCMGEMLAKMEFFVFFTSILQFYSISPEPGKELNFMPDVTLLFRPHPQNIVLTRRD